MRAIRHLGLLAGLLIGLAVSALLACLVATLPPTKRTVHLSGLHHPVTVRFDAHGVPHIQAGDLEDAAVATGYVHARDRMLQMELMRRLGSGRIAEIAGPAGLPTDRMMRTMGLRRLAEASYASLLPDTRGLLDAYARGVNLAIADRGRFIAPEFVLFGRPAAWTPPDSLLWGRLMGLSLAGNWRTELDRLGDPQPADRDRLLRLFSAHPETRAPDRAALGSLAGRLAAALPRFPAPYTQPDEASDEWAVDGRHSNTGAPLLAGDPHLAFGFPALWYLVRIDVPGLSLAGATAPGVPFLVIGQNGHVAWTFTSNSADTQDLFVETVLPDGRYATPDGPRRFALRTETIHVRGAPDVTLTIRVSRHGPVISDALSPGGAGRVLALSAENLQADDAAPGLAALDRATDIDQAGSAAPLITSPVQNLLVADHDRIAQYTTGRVPVRRAGDGSFPADGASGASDWVGLASGQALPHIVAPASGQLLNGNERTAPPDFPVFLGRDWPAPWRAERIRALLAAHATQTLEGFGRMQSDIDSAYAAHLLPLLLAHPPAAGGLAASAFGMLAGWHGTMDEAAPQPLIFNAWVQRFVADVEAHDHITDASTGWEAMADLLLSPDGAAWCDGDCAPFLARALDRSMQALSTRYGDDPARWRWGQAHRAVFDNPLLRAIPLVGWLARERVAIGGDDTTLLRGGNASAEDFQSRHGAAYRGLYDLADQERSRFIVTPGQSGNWLSPGAWNLVQDWAKGSSIQLARTPARVAATLSLLP